MGVQAPPTATNGTTIWTGTQRGECEAFLGIRYAVAERFQAPRPFSPSATEDASVHGHRCPQPPNPLLPAPAGEIQSEDCLFLDVYTPAADRGARPVLVWIHGGSYVMGAASDYDGSAIAARHDVTVVAINYRLGLFGFVDVSCLGTDHVGSAANGIADQIAALGWIRDNISSFGGDPDNVTVAGQSAGAGSVLGLIAAPASHGLFRRAIVASPGSLLPEPPDLHVPLAAALGVTIEGLGDALLGASSDQLVAAQQTLGIINAGIDGTVITSDPIDALSDTAAPLDALMIGTTADEGTLFTAMLGADSPALAAATALGVRLLDPPVGAGRYLAGLRAASPDADERRLATEVFTDSFRRLALRCADASASGNRVTFLYRFDFPTTSFGGVLGATHGCDIPFILDTLDSPMTMHDPSDPTTQHLATVWSGAICAFARTGSPNLDGLPRWPEYSPEAAPSMILDAKPSVGQCVDELRLSLWGDRE